MELTAALSARIRDELAQPCPRVPEHRIRPVTVHLSADRDGHMSATLLGVCDTCWPTELSILDVRLAVPIEQARDWAREQVGPRTTETSGS